jgi:hypothetical protein
LSAIKQQQSSTATQFTLFRASSSTAFSVRSAATEQHCQPVNFMQSLQQQDLII